MMKKRILITLLCGVILASSVSCKKEQNGMVQTGESSVEQTSGQMGESTEASIEKSTEKEKSTEEATLEPTSQTSSEEEGVDDPTPPVAPSVFDDYQDLLGALTLLQQENGEENFRVAHPDLDNGEEKILASLCEVDKRALGYCIKDLTSDGTDELILLYSSYSIRAVYTLHEGKPVLVKQFGDGGVENGILYDCDRVEEDVLWHYSYAVGKIENGKYVETSSFGYTYHTDTWDSTDPFWIENGKSQTVDFLSVRDQINSLPIFSYVTKNSGVTYTRLFEDGTTVEDEGKNYRITKTNGVYKVEIFDKDGKLVHEEESISYIYCWTEDGDILQFKDYSTSPVVSYFYSVSKNLLSRKFQGVKDVQGERVAYTALKDDVSLLVVENIFDKTAFYKEYESPQSIYSAYFAPDGKSVEISFGSSTKPSKRVFCFENLPILKVTTICYVRVSASIYDDVYMISSGHPALLRPANEDTVRLLETVEGGTYKDADGNERKDWYRILYRGREMYVTADSFEVLTYEVK